MGLDSDTIFAPATAAGPAGVAVVRVSGPAAADAITALAGIPVPAARVATRVRLREPATGDELDDGLCLWFPAPRSFTGEDVVEFQLHGGRATIAAVTAALGRLAGLRFADPGEFTRRAFRNDKLDLTAAEGLADLVAAETEAQRRQALRQLGGALGAVYEGWRARLVSSLARIEATIDFPDEDLPQGLLDGLKGDIVVLMGEMRAHLDDARRGERLRDGIAVAIVGAPNVGKSSLLNLLAKREAAIVSETEGTTRDVIEIHLDLNGFPAILADTAGLRDSEDVVEREGVARAQARAEQADLRILVLDALDVSIPERMTPWAGLPETLVIVNKMDLCPSGSPELPSDSAWMAISVRTGAGVEDFLAELSARIEAAFRPSEAPGLTRQRHRLALETCIASLGGARDAVAVELIAEDLRLAARSLGRITGRVGVEDVLDSVFRDFCIGK